MAQLFLEANEKRESSDRDNRSHSFKKCVAKTLSCTNKIKNVIAPYYEKNASILI